MILCFAVENLEWEFEDDDDSQRVDISNCGKTIKNTSGYYAKMRLNNENKINLKYRINVRVESELQNDDVMLIGLVNSENWDEIIYYDHYNGQICDNYHEIKKINKKVNKGSIIKIENKIVRKTNDNKNIFIVSFTINEEEKYVVYYQDVQPMVPNFLFHDVVEIDVEVISKILNMCF